ncbi:hypothetical protein [Mucilaginibacter aquatilis]|uniref:Uncharacterized protein n=1 Tax=Mucilaginibacter aquatilis TaxID=1517760 RepID=A0A6I4I4Q0_9SPHI|nr:hypothetical protein [Mucilaginibacter aquatilis]MVN90051.1 hypothetical protein [Mucilaginibacter aquatilis]
MMQASHAESGAVCVRDSSVKPGVQRQRNEDLQRIARAGGNALIGLIVIELVNVIRGF